METFVAVRGGECNSLYEDLIACNERYEYDYGKKCKNVRESLQMCAIKTNIGELKKWMNSNRLLKLKEISLYGCTKKKGGLRYGTGALTLDARQFIACDFF